MGLRFKGNEGFALVEVLAVMAILGLVAALAVSLHLSAQKTWEVVAHREELQQNLRIAMERISSDVRESSQNTVTVDNRVVPNRLEIGVDKYWVDSGAVLKRNSQPITTPEMKVVGFYIYEEKIRGQKIFTLVLGGRKGSVGFELQTKVSPRVH